MADLPVACTLTSAALRNRREESLPGLLRRSGQPEDIVNGYRFQFGSEPEVVQRIAAVIAAERQCCRFLRFQLTTEPDLGPIALEITGPPGTREFLDSLMDPNLLKPEA